MDYPNPRAAIVGRNSIKRPRLSALHAGLVYLGHQPLLRAFAGTNTTFMFFYGMVNAIFLLFLTKNMGISESTLGLRLGGGSVGGLLGAIISGPISQYVGIGPTILGASLLRGLGIALIPFVALVSIERGLPFVVIPFTCPKWMISG